MWWISYTGSIGYVVPLWLLTGVVILLVEKKGYQRSNMDKERKVAGVLGWMNLSAGALFYIATWILRQWS